MHRTQAFALLSLLLVVVSPCGAQMMDPSEYRSFLKRLDASAAEWREQFEALHIERLNVTYSLGKKLEAQKKIGLTSLTRIHDTIDRQLTKDSLSDDVRLQEYLDMVHTVLGDTVSSLPDNAQTVHWAKAIPSQVEQMSSYESPLRKHVLAYADQLQEKAAKCSRK